MNADIKVPTDDRDLAELAGDILARHAGYVPEWQPADKSAGNGLVWIFARFLQTIIQRLNGAPEKNRMAFFDLLGIGLVPARSARAPIVFQLTENAADTNAPAATQVAAPPPPGAASQIVFETEQAVGVASAKLVEVVSLWSGRDQYLDHSADLVTVKPFTLFDHLKLRPTPHIIYIAHDRLLALTASVHVDVEFELVQPASGALEINWEYWDGQVWRGFKGMDPACFGISEAKLDGTNGLTNSGTFHLQTDCAQAAQVPVSAINAYWIRGRLTQPLPPDPSLALPQVTSIRLSSLIEHTIDDSDPVHPKGGLLPDNALFGATKLDLTKAFYPLGQQPQPGSTFYFSSDEVLGKAGAMVEIAIVKTSTPQDQVSVNTPTPLPHVVAWEYWNGTDWFVLALENGNGTPSDGTNSPSDLAGTGQLFFTVPKDMVRTKVNGQDGLWVRARLVSGGFGFSALVKVGQNSFTYVVNQPPALGVLRLGYSWRDGPYFPEHVVTYNDFQYEDRTFEAQWPGSQFLPFKPVADISPALYLGFNRKLPVADLGFYFDIATQQGNEIGPALIWEYWNGGSWAEVSAQDETQDLRVPGIVSFIGADDSQALARFDSPYFWVRARLKEDAPPGEAVINAIYANAVWASQQRTLNDAPLGTSSGLPNQVFLIAQIPVLDGERIEVQELSGPRANVEWRILAAEIAAGDTKVVSTLEQQLAQEGTQTDIVYGDIRLRRDRTKKVAEVWVRWQAQPNFYFSGPAGRHYVMDRATGRVYTGDGINGRIPPPGANVAARQFRSGGGAFGNVPANTIKQLLGSVPGMQSVFNPRAAEGGSDGEMLESYSRRAPYTLRARGRAMTASDYETLAREASSAVALAHAIPTHDGNGRALPGWITVVIMPRSQEPQPVPSYGLRDEVRKYIEERAPADVAHLHQVYVRGPYYTAIDIRATLIPVNPSESADVEQAALDVLEFFLHPLTGGPEGKGWPPGRNVYLSDVASALRNVHGLDFVEELALYKAGVLQDDRVIIGPDRTAAAGEIRLNLKAVGALMP